MGGYGFPDPLFAVEDHVQLPMDVLKNVAFIGVVERGRFSPRATGFFVAYDYKDFRFVHFVTAEHVVSGLMQKGLDLYLRVNLANGETATSPIDPSYWTFYPDEQNHSDVAICSLDMEARDSATGGPSVPFDARAAVAKGKDEISGTRELLTQQGISIGGELFIVGLFRSHYGRNLNRPIIRVGHLAAMADEPVLTSYAGHTDAYLIEAMSIGGLSGSPVYVAAPKASKFYLLGLVSGHFDIRDLNSDSVVEDAAEALGNINTGVAVVIPVEKIIATLEHPDLQKARDEFLADLRSRGATPDSTR